MPDPLRQAREFKLNLTLPETWTLALHQAAKDAGLSMHEYVRAMFEGNEELYEAAKKLEIELPPFKAGKKGNHKVIVHPELREHFRTAKYPQKQPLRGRRPYRYFDAKKPDDWDDENE